MIGGELRGFPFIGSRLEASLHQQLSHYRGRTQLCVSARIQTSQGLGHKSKVQPLASLRREVKGVIESK